ncbi:acetylxylan esterase [Pedobacter heparinus]|uniref:alpha/beta hydrolase family protein n=1 Tax=Pedobacter heparinus TaxID=984 RepID=UPI002931187A|nr:acetylxylan esterase [Pedobacter heparinus]
MKTAVYHFLIAFFIASPLIGQAQQPKDVYKKTLGAVLTEVEQTFQVKINCDDRLKNAEVQYASWRITSDLGHTLDNILNPIGLGYREMGNNTYLISRYEYYRRSESAGSAHLDELLKSYPDAAAFDKRKRALRNCMLTALGINQQIKRTPLNPIIRAKVKMHGYTVQNVAFESIPGYFVCGTLYLPNDGPKPFPVILSPNGHFYGAGESMTGEGSGRYGKDVQYRCAALAKMGAIVFNYDMYSWGESAVQTGSTSFHETGFSLAIQTWNSMRALDFLLSLPNADKSRVGVTGASGGGTQSFLLAALDDRISISVPVVMVSSSFYGGCPCESGLPIHDLCDGHKTNNTEIAALIAPKPLLVISDGTDWTRSVPGTDYPYLKKIYGFYGKGANIENVHLPNEGHDYGYSKRVPMYGFFAKKLGLNLNAVKNKAGKVDESGCRIQKHTEMQVFTPANAWPLTALKGHEAIQKAFLYYHSQ